MRSFLEEGEEKERIEVLVQRIKHNLLTTLGREYKQASATEIYLACSQALREEIVMYGTISRQSILKRRARMLYYLSMEYLPGRFLDHHAHNLRIVDLLCEVMRKLGTDYQTIMQREKDPGLGNGGLGRLASCFLDSLATHHYPACGYGLRYYYGMFAQELKEGRQIEKPDRWLLHENPWEFRSDDEARVVHYGGKFIHLRTRKLPSLQHCEEVRAIPYDIPITGFRQMGKPFSVVNLRLWSTKESPRNFLLEQYNRGDIARATENITLTDILYPNDQHEMGKRVRLKQEFLLVSCSLQDILSHHLKENPDLTSLADRVRIQINDTHPALVIPELMRLFVDSHQMRWEEAWELVQHCTSYTNHTVLPEALEQWDRDLFRSLLPRQYELIERINSDFCQSIRARYSGDEYRVQRLSILENQKVRMAHLAFVGAHQINGVAPLHTELLRKRVFRELHEMFPQKLLNVTNGVTQRHWLLRCNRLLSEWITEKIGEKWKSDFSHIADLHSYAEKSNEQERLLAIKRKNKERWARAFSQEVKDPLFSCSLSLDSLFDVQVKRIHQYKRQLMNALHLLIIYFELKENSEHSRLKRSFFIGGKAAPGYLMAKSIIRLFACIARKIHRDQSIGEQLRVLFVPNYNISKAELIIPAADLSEQISTAGMEASGTGNMKFAINGALTIGTEDGANIEMRRAVSDRWWPFRFGLDEGQVEALHREGNYSPRSFCAEYPLIQRAVESLQDGSLAESEQEQEELNAIYYELMEGEGGRMADYYLVLRDLPDYYQMQKRVEELYRTPSQWAACAIHNLASMGEFSSDRSIADYANKIWQLSPCPPDAVITSHIRKSYLEHDRCRLPSG